MLRKLLELHEKGVKLSKNYNMTDDYKSMKYEYEMHRGIRDKRSTVAFIEQIIVGGCGLLERGNESFNPFDFQLTGWSESINNDVHRGNYSDVLGDIYERHFKSGKPTSPFVKLFGMLVLSAVTYHFIHGKINGGGGGRDGGQSLLDSDPELVERLRKEAQADHDEANKKMIDMQMLREQEIQYLRQQQNIQQQNIRQPNMQQPNMQQPNMQQPNMTEYQKMAERLRMELNNTRSDSRSAYPESQPNQRIMRQPSAMSGNFTSPDFYKSEIIRQQEEQLARKRINLEDTPSHSGDVESSINPGIEAILNSHQNNNNDSKDSNGYNKSSKRSRPRRRRKKTNFKINTDLQQ